MSKRKKNTFFRCIFIILFLFFVFEVVKQEIKIYEINNEIAATHHKIAELSNKYQILQEEHNNIDNPEYIEKIAREEYNMVRKMEVPVLVKE